MSLHMEPMHAEAGTSPQKFTVLDWIGTLATGLTIAGLMAFPAASFRTIFHDLSSPDDLPLLTRMALYPWFSVVLAAPALVAFAFGLQPRRRLSLRRKCIAGAFLLACLGSAVCVVAMYLPVFTITGKIKAD